MHEELPLTQGQLQPLLTTNFLQVLLHAAGAYTASAATPPAELLVFVKWCVELAIEGEPVS